MDSVRSALTSGIAALLTADDGGFASPAARHAAVEHVAAALAALEQTDGDGAAAGASGMQLWWTPSITT